MMLEELAWRAARHGLSYTYPLMDREVLEFAVRLPPDFLVRDGHRRAAMRDAMHGILPEYSRLRPRKLVHDAAMGARFALLRGQLLAVVDGLTGTAAENLFTLAAIRADIAALPDCSDAIRRIETAARAGQQDSSVSTPAAVALKLARYVAEHGD